MAENFAAAGAQRIHVVDLDGALNGRESTNRAVVKEMVGRLSVPIQFGGGIRTLSDVEDLINSGVASVILGTLATESFETLKELVKRFRSKIAVGIDARDGVVMTHGWAATTKLNMTGFACEVGKLGVRTNHLYRYQTRRHAHRSQH